MVRAGLHWDNDSRTEWLVLKVRATFLIGCVHGACYLGTHLIRFASALPIPRGLYFLVHDTLEPPLRRWCEQHPSKHWT